MMDKEGIFMTLRNRIFIYFSIIIVFLISFGTYQNRVFVTLSKLNESSNAISDISSKLQLINVEQIEFMQNNKRSHVTKVFDLLNIIRDDKDKISKLGISKEATEVFVNSSILFDEYEVLFNQFVSNNDKYFAKMTQVKESKRDVINLSKALSEHPDIENYMSKDNLLGNIIEFMQSDMQNLRSYHVYHEEALTELIKVGEIIKDSDCSFDLKLNWIKLIHVAKNHIEYEDSMIELSDNNIVLQSKLNSKVVQMDELFRNIESSQMKYTTYIIKQLKVMYFSLLIVVVIVVTIMILRISKRIKDSFDRITKGTESIASGDYSIYLGTDEGDEFSELSVSINSMAKSLQVADFEIKHYSIGLEKLVEEKTAELSNAKIELEKVNKVLNYEKEKYEHLAMTDPLTGLYNRAFLIEVLNNKINEFNRYGRNFSVMLVDLDRFKLVNDKFGHMAGDDVLKKISNVFVKECRSSDIVARYGGEEFMLVFSECSIDYALVISERIRHVIEQLDFEYENLKVTISGGLAQYNKESRDEFLMKVDDLLYMAKEDGRNNIKTNQSEIDK